MQINALKLLKSEKAKKKKKTDLITDMRKWKKMTGN